jgi:hypothetical protein
MYLDNYLYIGPKGLLQLVLYYIVVVFYLTGTIVFYLEKANYKMLIIHTII